MKGVEDEEGQTRQSVARIPFFNASIYPWRSCVRARSRTVCGQEENRRVRGCGDFFGYLKWFLNDSGVYLHGG